VDSCGIREAKPDFLGFALFDRIEGLDSQKLTGGTKPCATVWVK
jgi:hypothetical protein